MLPSELNAALADERVRERWLKRILPALAITVIYFVFISDTLVSKTSKAEDAYNLMNNKGLSEDSLLGMRSQISNLKEELGKLQKEDEEVKARFSKKAAFLYGESDPNAIVEQLSRLMLAHDLRVIDETGLGKKKIKELPQSYAQLKMWLGDVMKADDSVNVHRLRFAGYYADVYEALREMALGETKAMPLFLSMAEPDKNDGRYFGMKIWTLDLWI